ncbi:MAG: hypothetical protein ACRBB0_25625 [Pelagimonas sp.]|uniref:hypothetical protein n=1 Tax=Pelagimonas sp. TaxID=2073170 RepID=UPI003D6B78A5
MSLAEIENQITDLLGMSPLPADAEAKLDALISQLPEENQEFMRQSCEEGLIMARDGENAGEPSLAHIV